MPPAETLAKLGLTAEEWSEQSSADRVAELTKSLRSGMTDELQQLYDNGRIQVAETRGEEPSASVKVFDDGSAAIAVNDGLSRFAYRITRALSRQFRDRAAPQEDDPGGFQRTCEIVEEVFCWFAEVGCIAGPDYDVSREQLQIGSMLATAIERFFIAHELAHVQVAFGHSDSEIDRVLRELDSFDEEHVADILGLDMVLQTCGGGFQATVAYAGAELLFWVLAGLEALGVTFEAGSHPGHQQRIAIIRWHAEQRCVDAASWKGLCNAAQSLEHLWSSVISHLRGSEYDDARSRAGQQFIEELDGLLDRHSGGMIPDYMGFYMNAMPLVDRGYSAAFCECIRSAAADFASTMQREEGLMDDAGRRAFFRWKLLVGLSLRTREPLRSVLEEALQVS